MFKFFNRKKQVKYRSFCNKYCSFCNKDCDKLYTCGNCNKKIFLKKYLLCETCDSEYYFFCMKIKELNKPKNNLEIPLL